MRTKQKLDRREVKLIAGGILLEESGAAAIADGELALLGISRLCFRSSEARSGNLNTTAGVGFSFSVSG